MYMYTLLLSKLAVFSGYARMENVACVREENCLKALQYEVYIAFANALTESIAYKTNILSCKSIQSNVYLSPESNVRL